MHLSAAAYRGWRRCWVPWNNLVRVLGVKLRSSGRAVLLLASEQALHLSVRKEAFP